MKINATVCFLMVVALMGVSSVSAQTPPDALMPGYRVVEASVPTTYNPFEPIREIRSDVNDALTAAFVKRLKGYVVQATGVPLLIIDGKSYKVGDKVPMTATESASTATATADGETSSAAVATAAPAGGEMATILSVSATEAVFRKDDPSGFGGEIFKIYYNFSRVLDSQGNPAYDVWEPVATGFFVSEDGLVVAPLELVISGEVSVQTQNGPRKAILVDGDEKTGLALLKVGFKSMPLTLSAEGPSKADAVFPVGYLTDRAATVKYMEGFVGKIEDNSFAIKPVVDGEFAGSPVLNRNGEVVGVLLGNTQQLDSVARLTAKSTLFRRYPLPELKLKASSRSAIEQSVVQILKKK